jgi:hypothetical protein
MLNRRTQQVFTQLRDYQEEYRLSLQVSIQEDMSIFHDDALIAQIF